MQNTEDTLQATIKAVSEIETQGRKGWLVTYAIDGYGDADYFVEQSVDFRADRLSGSGMPYQKNLFEWGRYGVDTAAEAKIADAFVDKYIDFRRDGRGLYIYSEAKGSGKTLLACCLAMRVIDRYNTVVKFVTAAEYIDRVRDKDPEVQTYKDCALLILDDIGAQSNRQEWVEESLYKLVDHRYRKNLSTIYTSNLRFDKASGSDRTFSRIYGASVPLKLPEISVRDRLSDSYRDEFLERVLGA